MKTNNTMTHKSSCLNRIMLLMAAVWLTTEVSARSHFQMVKFPMPVNTEQRMRIDSTMRAQPGVFSVSWSRNRRMLIVVYDRTITSRRQLQHNVDSLAGRKEQED
jgi:hypothetical protein